jgi:hypothetical protein
LPRISGPGDVVMQVNTALDQLDGLIYGYQDYAVLAWK